MNPVKAILTNASRYDGDVVYKTAALHLALSSVVENLDNTNARAAYAALLPGGTSGEHTNPTINVIVDLPDSQNTAESDAEGIRTLDAIAASELKYAMRLGEPIDFGFSRIHGRDLYNKMRERYGNSFRKIYPLKPGETANITK